MEMIRQNQQLDEFFLEAIEQYLGFKLPLDYRIFMIKFNGGKSKNTVFSFKDDKNDGSNLSRFFGFTPLEHENIMVYYRDYVDRIPKNMFPIAADQGGNLVLISIKMADRGKIFFWDHEMESGDDEEPSYANLTLIADTFREFIENLKNAEEL